MDGVLLTYPLFVKNPVVYWFLSTVKYLCIILTCDYIIELLSSWYKEILTKEVYSIYKKREERQILNIINDELDEFVKKVEEALEILDKGLGEIDGYVETGNKCLEDMNETLDEIDETFDELIESPETMNESFQETEKTLNELIKSSEEISKTLEDMRKSLENMNESLEEIRDILGEECISKVKNVYKKIDGVSNSSEEVNTEEVNTEEVKSILEEVKEYKHLKNVYKKIHRVSDSSEEVNSLLKEVNSFFRGSKLIFRKFK